MKTTNTICIATFTRVRLRLIWSRALREAARRADEARPARATRTAAARDDLTVSNERVYETHQIAFARWGGVRGRLGARGAAASRARGRGPGGRSPPSGPALLSPAGGPTARVAPAAACAWANVRRRRGSRRRGSVPSAPRCHGATRSHARVDVADVHAPTRLFHRHQIYVCM